MNFLKQLFQSITFSLSSFLYEHIYVDLAPLLGTPLPDVLAPSLQVAVDPGLKGSLVTPVGEPHTCSLMISLPATRRSRPAPSSS